MDREKEEMKEQSRQHQILSKTQAAQIKEGKAFMQGLTTDFSGLLMVS